VTLSELTSTTQRLALVGLAKNTGKTETLAALLRELQAEGRRVGVTSVGRDGEERDVIDSRISKPRVRLAAGSLVATTDGLLRASGIAHELLEETHVRTPLGRVLMACLHEDGAIEVAGPSAAADVRAVSDAMLAHGAEQVLIDGAVDRRVASSPRVSDGLVMATGAVLDRDEDVVVKHTRDAVDLVRLPLLGAEHSAERGAMLERLRELAAAGVSALVGEEGDPAALPPRFVLTAEPERIGELLDAHAAAGWLLVAGALPERFLSGLLHSLQRRRRELTVIASDPTRVFLSAHGPEWYRQQGIHLMALESVALEALTINPVAPGAYRFDSERLRAAIAEAIPDVPIFDVLSETYAQTSRFVSS
jgi:hypothetical protein